MVSTNEIIAETAVINTETEIKAMTEDEFEKATKLFQSGKKNLFLNKYDESANNIDEACKAYVAKYGEMGPQCAEVYFFYGRALLELARIEQNVLGNALDGVPEDTSPIDDSRYGNPEDVAAEEKEEIAEKVMDALCSTDEEIKNDEEIKKAEETVEKCEEKTETTETTEAATTTETATTAETKTEEVVAAVAEPTPVVEGEKKIDENVAEPKEGEEEGDEEVDEEEDDEEEIGDEEKAKEDDENEEITNLQRSWEMFELAKVIYEKNFNDDLLFKNKRIAECFMKLGEISIEQENYEQAIIDISESIRLQEEIKDTERDERMLAETYYQLGLARQSNIQFTEANDSFQRSINIVQLKIEKLKGKLLQIGEGADGDLEKSTINDEIAELETLLPEMISKLEENTEQSVSAIKKAKEFLTSTDIEAKFSLPSINGADIKDITSLVKSKRKFENGDETSVKKTRLSSENGNAENNENGEENNHIEIDNNKPISDENKENKMEETTETPVAKIAEITEQIEQPIEAEPIANA